MKTRIIVDSTCDLLPEQKSRVHVVPLTVHFGQEEYVDGITIDHKSFYDKLVNSAVHPSTSQAPPAAFAAQYEQAKAAGDSAVVITVASALSGTCQSARIAAEDYDNIHVVDSQSVAIGTGILVTLALRLLDEGLEAPAIAQRLEEEKSRILLVARVDTLEYLKRGGRVSRSVALAGSVLNIKPVLAVRDGQITILGKARGSRQGNNLLVEQIHGAGGVDFSMPVLLGYTGINPDNLLTYIQDSRHLWQDALESVPYTTIGSVIGTHAGPGAVAVAFFKQA